MLYNNPNRIRVRVRQQTWLIVDKIFQINSQDVPEHNHGEEDRVSSDQHVLDCQQQVGTSLEVDMKAI